MLKGLVKWVLKKSGYEVKKVDDAVQRKKLYQLYAYRKRDGSFDYQAYKEVQTAGNKRKLNATWVIEDNIAFLSEYLENHLGKVDFGICHGTRSGKEQAWFHKYLGCDVLGTELSETATNFENTIQWDFHDAKPEWLERVDFIYSNSFDHSYDPEKCLNTWMSCLKPGGICIIEHNSANENARELDPFGVDIAFLPYLVLTWGKGRYSVRELMDTPVKRDTLEYSCFVIIQKLLPTDQIVKAQ